MQKLQFNASLFNSEESQKKLDTDYSTLTLNECLFFINECEFDVLANKEMTLFKVLDFQCGNLGDIESENFTSLHGIIDRFSDTYLVDYGFLSNDDN